MLTDNLNNIGLLLDIGGVFIIYKFGLPDNVNREGKSVLIIENVDPEEIKKGKKYDNMAAVGILLLIVGFALQIIHNLIH